MAKKQTRRSISVSRATYERLRAYCETNGISMSQFVEHQVGDFLGRPRRLSQPVAVPTARAAPVASDRVDAAVRPAAPAARPTPPAPAEPTPEQIFTF